MGEFNRKALLRISRLRIKAQIVGKENSNISHLQTMENSTDAEGNRTKRKSGSLDTDNSPDRCPAEKKPRLLYDNENSYEATSSNLNTYDKFVYGNPKDSIVTSNNNVATDYDSNVLDLSCKKSEDSKAKLSNNTYHCHRNSQELPQRSNLEIKLLPPANRRLTAAEQLQIAKLQQQQRRSIQQQQKMLQQMRRSAEANTGRSYNQDGYPNKKESSSQREEEDAPNPAQGYPPHSFGKELPDGHPVLPLLDPVYFSALYNAYGFLPPSSPSMAAAFIGTLHEALPKLSMMFPPSNQPNQNPLLPQKNNHNSN